MQDAFENRSWLSPLNQRRWSNFKKNRRGYWSLWIFLILFTLTLFAEFLANDRPIIVSFKGEIYAPVLFDYPEEVFLGEDGFLPRPIIKFQKSQKPSLNMAGPFGRLFVIPIAQ